MTSKEAIKRLINDYNNVVGNYVINHYSKEIEIIKQDLDRLEELVELIEILDWYRIMMPYKTFADILEYSNDRVFIHNVFNKEWYRRRNIKENLEDDK